MISDRSFWILVGLSPARQDGYLRYRETTRKRHPGNLAPMPAHEHIDHGPFVRRRLYKDKSGSYCFRVREKLTGRICKVSTRQKVRRHAEKFAHDWAERKIREEMERAIVPILFEVASEKYLQQRSRHITPNTLREYESCFRQFLQPLGKLFVHEIEYGHIESCLAQEKSAYNRRRAGGPRSRRTRQKHLNHLRSFFRWTENHRYTRHDPTENVKLPRVPAKRTGVALTFEQARALLKACDSKFRLELRRSKDTWTQEIQPPRYLFLAALISLHTGLRRSNVLGLKWRHVNLKTRMIRLSPDDMKTGIYHEIPIHKEIVYHLAGKEAGPDEPVVGERLQTITKSFKSAVERAGLPRIRWHDLRHTFATWTGLKAPPAVHQSLLSHSPGTMSFHYTHVPFEEKLKVIDSMPPIFLDQYGPVFGYCTAFPWPPPHESPPIRVTEDDLQHELWDDLKAHFPEFFERTE